MVITERQKTKKLINGGARLHLPPPCIANIYINLTDLRTTFDDQPTRRLILLSFQAITQRTDMFAVQFFSVCLSPTALVIADGELILCWLFCLFFSPSPTRPNMCRQTLPISSYRPSALSHCRADFTVPGLIIPVETKCIYASRQPQWLGVFFLGKPLGAQLRGPLFPHSAKFHDHRASSFFLSPDK